jgi:DHA2 family multidrug resistance protein
LIQEQFPREKAGMAMAIFGMSVMVGPALGPTLGGWLTDNFGWRSIFNVNVPLGLLATAMSWLNVEDMPYTAHKADGTKHGIDWWGLLFLCVGVGCFQYMLERGEADGWWDSNGIRACAFFAVVGVASFIWWELKIPNPIMNLRLFKNAIVRSGTALMLMLGIMLYSLTFVVPIFVSRVISQMSATQTGELFIPGSVATAIFMLPVGMMLKTFNPKHLVLVGLILGEIAIFMMTRFTTATGAAEIYMPLIFRGVAMAFLFVPINQMVLGAFRGEELGQVAGMQNFFRQMGGSIGISSLDTLLTRFGAQHYNDLLEKVNAFNLSVVQAAGQAHAMPVSRLSGQVGFWNAQLIVTKSLAARVAQQVFILSFDQICWVIMVIVACGVIPLALIKSPKKITGPIIDAH